MKGAGYADTTLSPSRVLVLLNFPSDFHHESVQELGIGLLAHVSERIAQHRGLSDLNASGGM
jgi:hypothetical protein